MSVTVRPRYDEAATSRFAFIQVVVILALEFSKIQRYDHLCIYLIYLSVMFKIQMLQILNVRIYTCMRRTLNPVMQAMSNCQALQKGTCIELRTIQD